MVTSSSSAKQADESAKQPDWPFKLDAGSLLDSILYSDYSSVLKLSESWLENDTGKVKIILIKQQLDLLISDYNENIRFILSSIESYDMFFIAQTQFETSTKNTVFCRIQVHIQMWVNEISKLRSIFKYVM